jgi:hypothetical protein
LSIVLSFLRHTDSDYHFGIFKLFLSLLKPLKFKTYQKYWLYFQRLWCHLQGKKSLKISRGLSEFVNRRRTDNTIDKKKPIAMIYKTLHRKLTIKHHKSYEDWGWAQMLCKGKKSLKIPRGLSEFVNRRRTDNTIDKKTPIAMIYKTLHRKLTIKHHKPYEDWGWAQMLCKGKKSLKIPKW